MTEERAWSVRGLVEEIDRLVSGRYPRVVVEGEVAEIQQPRSGHVYLTLREPGGAERAETLPAVCWSSDWRRLRFHPQKGDKVRVRGRLAVYPARATLQLYVIDVVKAGDGDVARRIAERIERLRRDGLLDPARKRPLPAFPRVVGVVASPTGAALQDFLKVSRERFPAARIRVAPCLTQGPEAPTSIARALDLLLRDGQSEVVVITRGGGSGDDLAAFQDEALARAIAGYPLPTVSAVGHEVDTTIADLVADAVAPTPSAAAMRVLPDARHLARRVDDVAGRLDAAVARSLLDRRRRVEGWAARLRHPADRVRAARLRHDEALSRLFAAMERRRARDAQRVEAAVGRLDALSPLAVFRRGFSAVSGPRGLVRAADDVAEGDPIVVRTADGSFAAVVSPSRRTG
jgi:exodeoxyribonuclease VII large subunit